MYYNSEGDFETPPHQSVLVRMSYLTIITVFHHFIPCKNNTVKTLCDKK